MKEMNENMHPRSRHYHLPYLHHHFAPNLMEFDEVIMGQKVNDGGGM